MSAAPDRREWDDYVEAFHAERPGITEQLLRRARRDGLDPYEWCAEPLLPRGAGATATTPGAVLDVACGSGPLADELRPWFGVDRSAEELRLASAHGGSLVRAVADRLPFRDGAFRSAVSAMSMQIVTPLQGALKELARVVQPGGTVVLMVPARRPVRIGDLLLYTRLQLMLRRRIDYPNDRLLRGRRFARLLRPAEWHVVDDARATFVLPLRSPADAALVVSALYLPGVAEERIAHACALMARRVDGEIAIPLRRVVLCPQA